MLDKTIGPQWCASGFLIGRALVCLQSSGTHPQRSTTAFKMLACFNLALIVKIYRNSSCGPHCRA
jgi:hypothetical protein